jgi:hypothetical protein
MTSQIISNTIDAAFPVAGVDNNTQGFRDNFQIIKDGLGTAASEITELQDSTAKLDENNNFDGSQIASAKFLDSRHEISINGAPLTTGVEIDVRNAYYHRYVIGADLDISVRGWPQDSYAKIVIDLTGQGLEQDAEVRTVTLNPTSGTFLKNQAWNGTVSVDEGTTDSHIIELWTYNGGITVFGHYLGKFV